MEYSVDQTSWTACTGTTLTQLSDSDYDYAYAWSRCRYHGYDPKKKRKIVNCANNGRKPPQKINEGGGLSSVRKKAEQIGGSMKISTSEIFVLEITIPKSEVLQYDKSADS